MPTLIQVNPQYSYLNNCANINYISWSQFFILLLALLMKVVTLLSCFFFLVHIFYYQCSIFHSYAKYIFFQICGIALYCVMFQYGFMSNMYGCILFPFVLLLIFSNHVFELCFLLFLCIFLKIYVLEV